MVLISVLWNNLKRVFNFLLNLFQKVIIFVRHQWVMPAILATWEAEIREDQEDPWFKASSGK
jgi:hypothetical protein